LEGQLLVRGGGSIVVFGNRQRCRAVTPPHAHLLETFDFRIGIVDVFELVVPKTGGGPRAARFGSSDG
jgi:hypothetical protein